MKPPLNAPLLRFVARLVALYFLCWFGLIPSARAQRFPANFSGTQIATGLDAIDMSIAPDGRIFIAEKLGRIRIYKDGALLPVPALDIRARIDNHNERGVLAMALDPDFANNPYVYLHYTFIDNQAGNYNRVSRFRVTGDLIDPNSEQVLIRIEKLLSVGIHNGGGIFFQGGKLFILVGDNTAANHFPQAMNILKGKLLRINPDGSIPADNPFFNSTSGPLRSIYAIGLRNPFKGAAQPGTDRIFVTDVGGSLYEEINEVQPGKNFGWPMAEGFRRSGQQVPANYQDPIGGYDHSDGCSITAAGFYNPAQAKFPSSYVGKFFIGDYCNGWLKTFDPVTKRIETFATDIRRPIDVEVAEDGTFYFLARGGAEGESAESNTFSNSGVLWRVDYRDSGMPNIAVPPASQTATVGRPATFSVNASGNPAPAYQWQRNGSNIPGATGSSYTLSNVSTGDNGARFRVVVSNSVGSVTSPEATLSVTTNQRPVPSIVVPATGTTYAAGDVIRFEGTAADPEDGELPASAFTWAADLYHFDPPAHTHPAMAPRTGVKAGQFQISTSDETSPNVLYRIYLTVTDSEGASTTTTFDVIPRKSNISLATQPAGLPLRLDGREVTTPFAFTGVHGVTRNLEAAESLTVGSTAYRFMSWADGGERKKDISTPTADFTYTAQYMRAADNPANLAPGLDAAYYEGNYIALPNFGSLTPARTGKHATFGLGMANRTDNFALRFTGYLQVPTDGRYTFYTSSDDGSKLYIGGTQVVDNDGMHGPQERSGSIFLQAGRHPIEVTFFEAAGGEVLEVSYEGPGLGKQLIPASALFSEASTTTPPPVATNPPPTTTEPSTPPSPPSPPPASGECSPTTTFVSDLAWLSAENGWGPAERDRSNGEQAAGDGRPISIRGERYPKGLGVHAASRIVYHLGRSWNRFKADLGIDDGIPAGAPSSVVFEVWADGQRLYQSAVLRRNSPIVGINLDVTGREQLELVVTNANDGGHSDHGNWAGARLERTCQTTDSQAPGVPGNLRTSHVRQTSLTLTWDASTDNVGVTGYDVYRGAVLIGTVAGTTFNVTGLTAGMTYTFSVRAKDAAGNNSAQCAPVSVTTLPAGSPPPATEQPSSGGCSPITTFVSDLSWSSAENGWGPVERNRANGEQPAGDGPTLRLNGKSYAKGLGVHSYSRIVYQLGGTYARFKADVGLDDSKDNTPGSVVFEVRADGQTLFRSGTMRHQSTTASVDVSVAGRQQLELIVTDAGDGGNSDHGDWADARLERPCGTEAARMAAPRTDASAETFAPAVYPNPTSEYLHVALPVGQTARIEVLDLGGRTVLRPVLDGGRCSIGSLQPGTYLVRVATEHGTRVYKVIKQ
jgi:glucose/arabinose dehydrogenase